jgi:hypothetical protein
MRCGILRCGRAALARGAPLVHAGRRAGHEPVVLPRPAGDRRRQGDRRRSAVLVEQESPVPPGGLPKPGKPVVTLPDNHLQYAVIWYGLAGVLARTAYRPSRPTRNSPPRNSARHRQPNRITSTTEHLKDFREAPMLVWGGPAISRFDKAAEIGIQQHQQRGVHTWRPTRSLSTTNL